MARKPRGSGVPKTSGQGISRGIYQKNYALSGGAIGGGVKKARVPKGDGEKNRYAKGAKAEADDDFNIEFGGMFKPEDVKPLGDEPPKGWKDERQQGKKLKGLK